jgi:hypothetical protein
MDDFTSAYIEAMLWAENANTPGSDESDDTSFQDAGFDTDDFAPETLARIESDCAKFQAENGDLLTEENCKYRGCPTIEYAGHDFWLTRQGHGCGFWDGDWHEPAATKLTEASKRFGEFDIYVGDDGKIHH